MDLTQKKEQVLELLEACPLEAPLPECPAGRLRSLGPEDRREIVARMNPLAIDDILAYHRECMRTRRKLH